VNTRDARSRTVPGLGFPGTPEVGGSAGPPVGAQERTEDLLRSATGRGVRVAVADSGWNRNIPEPRVLRGVGLVTAEGVPVAQETEDDHDRIGHGTACIDLILRLAPGVEVLPLRVCGERLEATSAVLGRAVRRAVALGAPVLSVHVGTGEEGGEGFDALAAACAEAVEEGMVIVASDGGGRWRYPAALPGVIHAGPTELTREYRLPKAGAVKAGDRSGIAAPTLAGIAGLFLERHPRARAEDLRLFLARLVSGG
jgi:subtilisin family serine protease